MTTPTDLPTSMKFESKYGQVVTVSELEVGNYRKPKFVISFGKSKLEFGHFKSVFESLLYASFKNRKSMKDLDWSPQ